MKTPWQMAPGVFADDTPSSSEGRWIDASNVRFFQGKWEVIGGWELMSTTALTGVCRTVHPWTDSNSLLAVAYGTHSALQTWQDGDVYTITPTRDPYVLAGPFTTTNASAVVAVADPAHGLVTGQSVTFAGATAVGGLTLAGAYVVTVTSADGYTVTASGAATSSATGGGSVTVTSPAELAAGLVDGTGNAGFSTGAFSVGTWSSPSTSAYYARTWSLSTFGGLLIANPRGGRIYETAAGTLARATVVTNSPLKTTFTLVTPKDQIMAMGTNREADGVFDPVCIRHTSIRKKTEWTTGPATTAREIILPGGGEIVGGRVMGDYILVWTREALFLGQFSADLAAPWKFTRVPGPNCGLIGPNAAHIDGSTAYWIGPDLQPRVYSLGGAPAILPCPIVKDFQDNMTPVQGDKIVASGCAEYGEIRFDYPDARDGTENSRYLLFSHTENTWSRGLMGRTAYRDAGPTVSPIGIGGQAAYWHERGRSADGAAISWFIESADARLDEESGMMLGRVWPDFARQVGPVKITVKTRLTPQGSQRSNSKTVATGDAKADIRISGNLFSIRFEGSSSPASCREGSPRFELTPTGGR